MQFLMLNLWKGCSFPANIVKEKEWEALVEHFLPSARAVKCMWSSAHLGNHITQPGGGVALHFRASRDALTSVGLQSVLPRLCRCCCSAVCVSSSHSFGECSHASAERSQ